MILEGKERQRSKVFVLVDFKSLTYVLFALFALFRVEIHPVQNQDNSMMGALLNNSLAMNICGGFSRFQKVYRLKSSKNPK